MKMRNRRKLSRFADSIQNPALRVGTWQPQTFGATFYSPQVTTLNRLALENAYSSSWLAGLAVDIKAMDMTREGVEIRGVKPEAAEAFDTAFDDLNIWDNVQKALKYARLYGGSIAVILVDGDDMSQPLGKVGRDSFKGLAVFDRWQIEPSDTDLVQDLGRDFGKPRFYRILPGQSYVQIPGGKIHYSRVLRFEGVQMPWNIAQRYQGWGASVLERCWQAIKSFDLVSESISQLVSKSYLRYYKIKGLRDVLTNDLASKGFLKQMDFVRQFQSFEGMTLGDAEDEFQVFNYGFTGLPDIHLQKGQEVSGAIGVPMVRLFGQSPIGFNSTGESDLRLYYDDVRRDQDSQLRNPMKRLLKVMHESLFGIDPGKDFTFEFKPLWQLKTEEKIAAAAQGAQAIISAVDGGLLPASRGLEELKKLSDSIGVFSTISQDDITHAKEDESAQEAPDIPDITELKNGDETKPHVPGGDEVPENGGNLPPVPRNPDEKAQGGGREDHRPERPGLGAKA